MSDALESTLWQRMRHTPLRDALRGRISGRLDIKRRLDAAAFEAPIQDVIRNVLKRTRLWRIEKVDVADELIAHFADGIETGESAESLVEAFGDARVAAKLIRRAVKRKRSLLWKTMSALRWFCVAMIGFYVLSGIVFYLGEPTVKINYVATLNEHLKNVPDEQRAWPLYRQAIPQLSIANRFQYDATGLATYLDDAVPGDPRWQELVQWLKAHETALEVVRQAAAKPALGFVYGPGGSAYDQEIWPQITAATTVEAYPKLNSVMIPYLNDLRHAASILTADARLSRHEGDTDRFLRDVEAILGIAGQLQDDSFLIQHIMAVGIRSMAVEQIAQTLADNPDLLQSQHLQQLAHLLANPTAAHELISLDFERNTFYDLVQRMYTDDGNGSGRLTPEGIRMLHRLGRPDDEGEAVLRVAAAPLSLTMTASRQEVVELYDRWMDRIEANLRLPAYQANPDPNTDEFMALAESSAQRFRFGPLLHMFPSTNGLQRTAERYLGMRDGVLVAIAAEVYRRQHDGQWPATLDALSPALLPSVPIDRITGGPLHYEIVDGKPLVYSVGVDRDDDGGRIPVNRGGTPEPWSAADWRKGPPENMTDGDWVLFPPED